MQKIKTRRDKWYWRMTNYIGVFLVDRRRLYHILSFTWGIPMTIVGYLLMLVMLPFGKIRKNPLGGLYFTFEKNLLWGMSIGRVIFVDSETESELIAHEFGHCVQNAIFGPFSLILFYLPSLIRYWYREVTNRKIIHDYDHIWFEGTATDIGHYAYTGDESLFQWKIK